MSKPTKTRRHGNAVDARAPTAEAQRVAIEWTIDSQITDAVPQSAGKRVRLFAMGLFEFHDGRIAGYREYLDFGQVLVQLGASPESLHRALSRQLARTQPQRIMARGKACVSECGIDRHPGLPVGDSREPGRAASGRARGGRSANGPHAKSDWRPAHSARGNGVMLPSGGYNGVGSVR
jgi:hypothetical protein